MQKNVRKMRKFCENHEFIAPTNNCLKELVAALIAQ